MKSDDIIEKGGERTPEIFVRVWSIASILGLATLYLTLIWGGGQEYL